MATPPPPGPPPGAPAVGPKPKLPGKVGIWIGILLIVGGIVGGIALIVNGATSLVDGVDDFQYVSIEAGGQVRIDEPGTIAVYAVRTSFGSGSGFSTGGPYDGPSLGVIVTDPDGQAVPVSPTTSSRTYNQGGREGVQIATFGAETAGTYRIEPVATGSLLGYDRLAVGPELDLGGVGAILGGVFGGGLVVLIGIIVLVVSAVRRSRARKALRPPSYGPSAYGGPPVGGGWAPPPVAVPGSYGQPGSYGAPGAYPPAPGGYPPAPPAPGGYPPAPPAPGGGSFGPPSSYAPPPSSGWPPPPAPDGGAAPGWVPPPAPPPSDYGQPQGPES